MKSINKNVRLRRELGLFSAVSLIISVMLGSGIFVSPANVLRNTGSIGMCLVIWTLCGLLSLLGALSYSELGSIVSKSGGEFSFYQYAFADMHKFWGPLVSFVYSWVAIMYVRPAEVAIIILTFAEYFIRPISLVMLIDPNNEVLLNKIVSILALGVITMINYNSVKCFIKVQNIFTICKIIACIFVIIGGFYQIYLGNIQNLKTGFEGTTSSMNNLVVAFYSGLWSYDGWTASITVFEEIKNPQRNIFLSILLAVPFVTLIYVLMNVSYLTVLTISEMMSVQAVAVEFGARALGNFSLIIPLGVAVATFGCALSIQFGITRLCFVASREGQMLEVFSYVSVKKLTPAPAVVLQGILTLICLLAGDIITLIEFASFLGWMFYGISMVALLVMRFTKSDIKRQFKVPIIIPVFVLIVSVVLFLTPIVYNPRPQYLIALVFILSAFLIYIPFVYQKRRLTVVALYDIPLKCSQ
ncbi:b(0,+)-type amino acid transporter 1-like isoform X2 [Daktulosphaira vitifoliae]|uniref:b(0,+)-type amino acid transporter 1-like isoform X2 n=1 Tax=Daktulosphaira vitifoliae TaxID=58002 RepID=UPI0021AAE710|nr:b(0,+)-type amino acid transporter 1-like isoform X2 [Daktulosphaira vitifoliae]